MKIFAITFLWSTYWSYIYGARFLGVLHVPTSSHTQIGFTLLNSLAERGHQVTVLSGLNPKLNNSNIRYIYMDGAFDVLSSHPFRVSTMWPGNSLQFFTFFINLTNGLTESALKSNAMKKLMNSGEQFDIVFIEPFQNQALVGLGQHFNAQVIVLGTSATFLVNGLSGNVAPYSFVPNGMSPQTDKMNFQEKLSNTLSYLYFHIANKLYNEPFQEKIYKEYFPNASDYNEAIKNVSLHLVNSHVVYESPRPYLPNMIPIGGIHIKPAKKLPKDIQEYLDNANQGAIFFSLGSYLQSKDISEKQRTVILNTFAKLPQKVLWKFENDLPGTPNNVKIAKWFPQADILAHPNLKLFITHGGLLSCVEALYRGVPILGIPFLGDQFNNIARFKDTGYGEELYFPYITEETFTAKIRQILSNSSYSRNIARASKILQDQSETPLERAIFWTEHVLKYGSSHLRSVAVDISMIEYLLLDIIAFVILVLLLCCLIIYFITKINFKNFTNHKHNKKE